MHWGWFENDDSKGKLGWELDLQEAVVWGILKSPMGTSLVVQWLIFHASSARDLGSVPGQGTWSHIQQLKILHATTKIRYKNHLAHLPEPRNKPIRIEKKSECFSFAFCPQQKDIWRPDISPSALATNRTPSLPRPLPYWSRPTRLMIFEENRTVHLGINRLPRLHFSSGKWR